MSILESTLVTGGTGLVGSEINSKYKISSRDADLRDRTGVEKLFKQISPKGVIHCAAKVGGLGANIKQKSEFYHDNIMINTNVLEVARLFGVKNLVSFLSTCIFPDKVSYPLTVENIHSGPPHESNYAYAYAKRMLEVQTRCYREQYGLNYSCIIPSNIYGINDNFNLSDGHVIPVLIHKCYLAKKNNSNFEVWGTGNPLREFVFAEDVARVSEWLLENYRGSSPVIVSSDEEVSIRELVEVIIQEMKFKGKVVWKKEMPDGQLRKPSDNSLLKTLVPEFSFTSLRDGIAKTVQDFEKNYKMKRK